MAARTCGPASCQHTALLSLGPNVFFFFLGGPENSTDLKGSLAHDVAKKKDLFINAVRTGTYQGNTGGPNRWHDEYT